MLKSKLERFLAKRVLIVLAILAVLDLILINQRWAVLIGLLIGGIFSLLRLNSMVTLISRLLSRAEVYSAGRKSILNFIINQAVIFVMFAASIKLSVYVFGGMVAGVLLVPFVILLNAITEASGITNNSFE